MLARFFRIFVGVLLAHLVLLNVIWVGFSAPASRLPVTFTYQGALPAGDAATADVWQKNRTSDQFIIDHPGAAYFNHWIEIRGPSKTFNYDHLGF